MGFKNNEAQNYQEQILIDTFYMKNGKCCAGCEHWKHYGDVVGECTNSKILPAKERLSMIGWESCSINNIAGHALTKRDYVCGQFKDDFNWQSLPLLYLKRIGSTK